VKLDPQHFVTRPQGRRAWLHEGRRALETQREREDARLPATAPPMRPEQAFSRLGIAADASEAEIRAAYRRLAKAEHSDSGGSDNRMTQLSEARDVAIAHNGRDLVSVTDLAHALLVQERARAEIEVRREATARTASIKAAMLRTVTEPTAGSIASNAVAAPRSAQSGG
jgi:hypothetical protein